jgi:hypothetical protein
MMFRLRYLFMIVLGVLYLLTGRLALVLANRKRHTKYMPLILTSCGLVGLLVGCIRIGPSRGYNYNELDVVQGELELVVPAEQRFVTTSMSSDGRWLFFISERKDDPKLGHYRHTLIDLEENKRYNLGNEPGRRFWIDHEHLAGNGVMLRVTDMVSWPLERVEQPPYSLGVLAGADHIYAREGSGSYFFVTTDPALPYWMSTEFKASAGVDNEELAAFLADRPHTIIRRNTSYGTSERAYSPDGRYYLASGPFDDPTHNLQQSGPVIYDATTDEPVTFAYKNGWAYYPLGWASDSSGIYVRYSPRSSSGDLLYNRHPIYKLLVPGATPSHTTPVLISLTPNSASAYPAAKPDALYRPALQSSVQGWYSDDVVVAQGTANTPTPTATPIPAPTDTAVSGTTAWWSNTPNSTLNLRGEIDLSDASAPLLTFQQQLDLAAGQVGQVRVLGENDLNWQPMLTVTGPITNWTETGIDLSAYAGQTVKLAFAIVENSSNVAHAEPVFPTSASTLATIPLTVLMLAGVSHFNQNKNRQRLKRWLQWFGWLALLYGCLILTGLWVYVPGLRTWRINHLTAVHGGETELIISASQRSGSAQLSPDHRWIIGRTLLNVETGETLEVPEAQGRWAEDGRLLGRDTRGKLDRFLMGIPSLERTYFPKYDHDLDIEEVKELVRQSETVYVGSAGSGFNFLVEDGTFRYEVNFPAGISKVEKDAFVDTLSQAILIPRYTHTTEIPTEYESKLRFFSPGYTWTG